MPTVPELIEAFRAGDEVAFEELLLRFRGMTHTVAGRYYAVGWEHQDLVLEAQVGLWEAAKGWSMRGDFSKWAYFVMDRKVISLVKSSTTKKSAPLRGHQDLDITQVDRGFGGTVGDPLEQVLTAEEHTHLLDLAQSIGFTTLEAVVLVAKANGSETYAEIASTLGIKPRAADNALQRARKKGALLTRG